MLPILIVTPDDISTKAHFIPLLFVTLSVFYQHVHWHAQIQEFMPGGYRPDCQKNSSDNVCSSPQLILQFCRGCTMVISKKTRTHSMARHRKSPRSRRNLMVIDPLTPSQGHQFDRRLKFFSVSWSTANSL